MKITFYLPTKENWCGAFKGGYVEVIVSNDIQPVSYAEDGTELAKCLWKHFVFIIFQGNDDEMWAKRYQVEDSQKDIEMLKAIELISKIPIPVTKKYLKSVDFESE